jgi:glycerol-3-phosphate dehydrogenase
MWSRGWRDTAWSELDREWDLIIIGGGVTGAGILREAARAGLRAVLFEAHDFASGTSSRSSKLVHGGLRYLRNAQVRTTSESVHERQRLLKDGRGLVSPLPFLMANFRGDKIPGWVFGIGLTFYDLLALKWNHRSYPPSALRELCPPLTSSKLTGGFRYFDAETDDARLVLRVLLESVEHGGLALNYARAESLLRSKDRRVRGVVVRDLAPPGNGRQAEVRGRIVVNATGAWADELRIQVGAQPRLRRLRGSHLVFSFERLPLTRAVTFLHPQDGRPVFIVPWEGATLIGTTDVDHQQTLRPDVAISSQEIEYLLAATQFAFPDLSLNISNVISTYSGVRAVVNTGKANPSKESRESVLWNENGLLTISGGKLTTFRLMAQRTLKAVRALLPEHPRLHAGSRVLDPLPPESTLRDIRPELRLRLLGRYGNRAGDLVKAARTGDLETIALLPTLWAELRWAARAEGVVHLDDLLLRRVRLGILLSNGGLNQIERIRAIVQPELSWDDQRWQDELSDYERCWRQYYAPEPQTI